MANSLIKLIQDTYTNNFAKINVEGWFSKNMLIRQGDSASDPILFSTVIKGISKASEITKFETNPSHCVCVMEMMQYWLPKMKTMSTNLSALPQN